MKNTFLNEVQSSLQNLNQSEEDYINILKDNGESDEIESAKSAFKAISKALEANPEDIVCLIAWNDDNEPIITGHDNLADNDSYAFDSYYDKMSSCPSKEIWQDEVWAGSPGSNQIEVHECPTMDGETVKVVEWNGSNWDFPWIYIKRSDLTTRLAI